MSVPGRPRFTGHAVSELRRNNPPGTVNPRGGSTRKRKPNACVAVRAKAGPRISDQGVCRSALSSAGDWQGCWETEPAGDPGVTRTPKGYSSLSANDRQPYFVDGEVTTL